MQLYSVCPFTKRWMFHDAIYKDNLIVIINHLKQNRNLLYTICKNYNQVYKKRRHLPV